jgi:hypothetical protein
MRMPEAPFAFPDPPLMHPERWNVKKGMIRLSSGRDAMDVDRSDDSDLPDLTNSAIFDAASNRTADENYQQYLAYAAHATDSEAASQSLHRRANKDAKGAFGPLGVEVPLIFAGHTVYLASDLTCPIVMLGSLKARIEKSGGRCHVAHELSEAAADALHEQADTIICGHRSGWQYWKVWHAVLVPSAVAHAGDRPTRPRR